MRISAGKLKHQPFSEPSSPRTHPMSDKLKNAVFNALGDIEGLKVLDVFGGTGALSFEAVSRGAKSVVVCENDKKAARVLRQNIKKLGLEKQIRLFEMNAYTFMKENELAFDVIFADPPYQEFDPNKLQTVSKVAKTGAILALSMPAQPNMLELTDFELIKTNIHGTAALAFYRRR